MPRFVKKPVEIDAWLYHPGRLPPPWFSEAISDGRIIAQRDHLLIPTLEGEMRADLGDWVIKGVKGELYPCKPDIFELTYEPVQGELDVNTNQPSNARPMGPASAPGGQA